MILKWVMSKHWYANVQFQRKLLVKKESQKSTQDRGKGLVTVAGACVELDMFYMNVNITAHIQGDISSQRSGNFPNPWLELLAEVIFVLYHKLFVFLSFVFDILNAILLFSSKTWCSFRTQAEMKLSCLIKKTS